MGIEFRHDNRESTPQDAITRNHHDLLRRNFVGGYWLWIESGWFGSRREGRQLLADAMKDAKLRAQSITSAVGSKLGAVLAVSSGPVQVTAPDSVDTSAGGMYDTATIPKSVTVTVSVSFKVSK
jgi:hypothetical protein